MRMGRGGQACVAAEVCHVRFVPREAEVPWFYPFRGAHEDGAAVDRTFAPLVDLADMRHLEPR